MKRSKVLFATMIVFLAVAATAISKTPEEYIGEAEKSKNSGDPVRA